MGREKRNENKAEQYTKLVRNMMQTPAWRALSPTAQALYPWIRMEWRGAQANNNGRIKLSVRQAAERMGVGRDTAARAFRDLQAKGFLVVRKAACLGIEGHSTSPEYELTEIGLPKGIPADPDNPKVEWEKAYGRKLYVTWSEGRDYPIKSTKSNNPTGVNGKRSCSSGVIHLRTEGRT